MALKLNQYVNLIEVQKDQTVDEFLSEQSIEDRSFTAEIFLDIKVYGEITNRTCILSMYNVGEFDNNQFVTGSSIIKKGTNVGLPNNSIRRDSTASIPQDIFQLTSFRPFLANALRRLLKDVRYYSETRLATGQVVGRTEIGDISVYIWIRSLNEWYDISAFVENIVTNINKDGGAFNFSLIPIAAKFDLGWARDQLQFSSGFFRDDVLSVIHTSKYQSRDDAYLSRVKEFFSTVLQENDLVYIRFEKLLMEQELEINKTVFTGADVPGKIYDMIGLLDNVTLGASERGFMVEAAGRDLMKVLVEDGSYFFVEAFAQNIFVNDDSILKKRNEVLAHEQKMLSYSYSFKSIQTILKYIFNKFSNIGYIPSDILYAYGDSLSKDKFNLQKTALGNEGIEIVETINKEFLQEEKQGVWQIIDMVFDPNATQRVLANNTIAQDNGSIINSIRQICQEPFVEFYGDTYGDRYSFVVRKPPFDEIGYKGMIYENVLSEDLLNEGIDNKDRLKKNLLDKKLKINTATGRPSSISELVIDIDEADVLNDQFTYSNEAYSWFRIIPRGLGVKNETTSFQLSPVIPIDEFAKIWGNKMYTIEYNYAPVDFVKDVAIEDVQDYAERQVFYDLQYLVQSHIYLPFTRHGMIKMHGNRTIKRGSFVYYKPTAEIFYVDSVSNVKNINERSTTISVSRGMREKYIKGVNVAFPNGAVKNVSYFTIMPTEVANNASILNTEFLKNWQIDTDVLSFFIQRRQWSNE